MELADIGIIRQEGVCSRFHINMDKGPAGLVVLHADFRQAQILA